MHDLLNTLWEIVAGDCVESMRFYLADKSVNCCVTSPPYFGLRSYLPGIVRMKKDAPEWVRELRKKNREDQRKIRELEEKLKAVTDEAIARGVFCGRLWF